MATAAAWKEVDRFNPCIICGKIDWCSYSSDGVWAVCRRIDAGDALRKSDRSGADYWLYRVDGKSFDERDDEREDIIPTATIEATKIERADTDTINTVYQALLNELNLSPEHRESLKKRGLSNEGINLRGYKTLPLRGRARLAKNLVKSFGGETCQKIPGLFMKQSEEGKPYWSLAGAPGIIVPLRDKQQRITALKVRVDKPGDGPKYPYITSAKRKDATTEGPGPEPSIHVPVYGGKLKSINTVRLTEGELKADIATALSGILTLSIPGVSTWRLALPVLRNLDPAPETILLSFDVDAWDNYFVARALQNTAAALQQEGFSVNLEIWSVNHGKGIDDVLAAGNAPKIIIGQEEVMAAVNEIAATALSEQKKKRANADPSNPVSLSKKLNNKIKINAGFQSLSYQKEKSWEAINGQPEPPMFRRGNALVRIIYDKKEGPKIENLGEAALRNTLDQVAHWYRSDSNDNEKYAYPTRECVQGLLADASPPVPYITRVVQAPVFGVDGSILTVPGFHEKAETWYHKTCDVPDIPKEPTAADIEKAKNLLLSDLLGDFPFCDDCSRAYALSVALQPFVRIFIKGPTPLHIIDAKSGPGTGKSLLADVLTGIATGRGASIIAEGRDEDEWRKRITSKLIGAPIFLLIDNIQRMINSSALAAAITATTWEDRLLGYSKTVALPVECCWLGTGNSVKTSTEIARRIVKIKLDAKVFQPWLRNGFRIEDLRTWAMTNRGELIWSALVLCQAWINKDMPEGKEVLGMFESWAKVMGGVLDVAGVPGFLTNLQEIYSEADEETGQWIGFVSTWHEKHGKSIIQTKDLHTLAKENDLLLSVLGDKGERSEKARLGKALSRIAGRFFGNFQIVETSGDRRNGTKAYYLDNSDGGLHLEIDQESGQGELW